MRSKILDEEVAALWIEMLGVEPPREFDGSRLLDILVKKLPALEYDRLRPATLAPDLVWPIRSRSSSPI